MSASESPRRPFHGDKIPLQGGLWIAGLFAGRRIRFGTMSDDSFIREVNQELRQDQARALWDRYGPIGLAIAVAVVLATAAVVGYRYWVDTKANASGDAFSQALTLANSGKSDE